MRTLTVLLAMLALAAIAPAEEKKGKNLKLTDLPLAVRKAVEANLKGGEIKAIGKEKENGIEQYEIETVWNGKSRDFNVDTKGTLLVVEEETTLEAIPAAARAGIAKKVGAGKLAGVETFTKPGQPTMYEATYTDSKGKKHEMLVRADGTKTKE